MKIYRYCLLSLIIFAGFSFSQLSASDRAANIQGSKLKTFAPGHWVPSETFVKKNTFCYREYTCRPNGSTRFGRNVRIERTKLQRRKSVCAGPASRCQCKTAPPTLACEVRFIKRR